MEDLLGRPSFGESPDSSVDMLFVAQNEDDWRNSNRREGCMESQMNEEMRLLSTRKNQRCEDETGDEMERNGMKSIEPTENAYSIEAFGNSIIPIAPKVRRQRLMIHKLLLENFKSYGGKRVIGPFHKRFSAIMGSNGSGKSNIIDAMLFVFGRRAKKLRLNTISELIHDSTSIEKTPKSYAKVTVYLHDIYDDAEEQNEYEVVKGSELTLSREVSYSGSSAYRMNGRESTHQNVIRTLSQRGIDLAHNRFLILQGEVEQIALMKAKGTKADEEGFLEYLEDIIGTNRFIEEIQAKAESHEAVDRLYQERRNRLESSSNILNQLEDQYKAAKSYAATEHDYLLLQTLLQQIDVHRLQSLLEHTKQHVVSLEMKEKEKVQEIEALDSSRADLSKDALVEEEREKELVAMIKGYENDYHELDTIDVEMRNELAHLMETMNTKKEQLEEFERSKPLKEQSAREDEAAAKKLEAELPSTLKEFERAEEALEIAKEAIKDELNVLSNKLNEAEKRLAPKQQLLDGASRELSEVQNELALLKEKAVRGQDELKALNGMKTTLVNNIKQNDAAYSEAKERLTVQANEVYVIRQKAEEMGKAIEVDSHELRKLQGEMEALRSQHENVSNYSAAYQHVSELVRRGDATGVHGRLAELGSIAPKYDTAWIAAAGYSADFVVVDTPSQASLIFDALRKQRLGRLTCVALEILARNDSYALKASDERFKVLPNGVERLIDLVKPIDAKFRLCFYHVVRDTLVCRNSSEADALSQKFRVKVVSWDGVVCEVDGRTTAGGTMNNQRGKLGGKSQANLAKDEAKSKAIQHQLNEVIAKIKALEQEKDKLDNQKMSIMKEMDEKRQLQLLSEQNIRNYKAQLKDVEKRLMAFVSPELTNQEEEEIYKLNGDIRKITMRRKQLLEDVNKVEAEIDSWKMQLENAGGEEMKKAKRRKITAERNLSKKRESIENLKVRSRYSTSDAEKMKKDIAKLIKEYEEMQIQYDELVATIKDSVLKAEEIESQRMIFEDLLKQQHLRYENAKVKFKGLDKEIEQKQLELVDCQHALDRDRQRVQLHESKIAAHQQKTLQLREKWIQLPNLAALPSFEDLDTINEEDEGEIDEGGDETKEYSEDMLDKDERYPTWADVDDLERLSTVYDSSCEFDFNNLDSIDRSAVEEKIASKKEEIDRMESNLSVIAVYLRKHKEIKRQTLISTKLLKKKELVKKEYVDLCAQRRAEFTEGFNVIAAKVKEIYQLIAKDGDAELEMVDITDPFAEGISFSVRPPKKSWKQIQNLSGGEKTLSSLALVFALHYYKPTPVYFMDEIDAALDFRNVAIIAHYIKEQTKDAQFIVISLRNQMFENFNHMVGIYKTHEVTKSIAINPLMYTKMSAYISN